MHDTKLTEAQAAKNLSWNRARVAGATIHRLYFTYDGRSMCYGEIEQEPRPRSVCYVEGSSNAYHRVGDAKREAIRLAMARLRRDGYVEARA